MQKLFHRILVPVDFSFRSIKAVEKAVVTAAAYQCSVTLLHVVTVRPIATVAVAEGHLHVPYDLIDNRQEIEFQLAKLVDKAQRKSPVPVTVTTDIVWGHWEEAVIDYIQRNSIDCVMIGQRSRFKKKRHMLLNPDKIADAANVPVITIPVNKKLTSLKSIVIPITDFFPVRKLLYGLYIAAHNNAAIELLGIEQEQNSEVTDYYLKKSADWLLGHGVTAKVTKVQHRNTAAAVTEFANEHETDLLILNPGLQTTMPGWWSSLIGNIIQKYSLPPVMTVNPA
jgi:nucleotide-binding universal stress UspA family protein